ncbi:BgTH12-03927 [Blumeria graminis f. sp. triticale]|uniref:BgTH12-03927 n=1 Tax=Blumeria graminis f. sp. triticale TaxID=1689686 RepID=A0A9W4GCL9_BLUGR|nr:BgTH12-03927 [Blumeria graminis f. sp. triticale]
MSSTIEKVKDILHINKDKNTTDTSNEIHRNDHHQGHVGSHNTATTDFTNVGASHQPETVPRYGKSEQITGYNDPSINSAKYDPQASGRLDICHVTDDESDTGCGLTSGKKGGMF